MQDYKIIEPILNQTAQTEMIIIAVNRIGDPSSNLGRGCLHFTSR